MSRGLRWLRLAAVCAVFLVGLPLLLRGRVTAGASVLYNVLLGGTALLLQLFEMGVVLAVSRQCDNKLL